MNTVTKRIPESAICGLNGKPVTLWGEDSGPDACDLINEYLGYPVTLPDPTGEALDDPAYLIPANNRQRTLSATERAAVEALAWYAHTFRRSVRREAPVTFPRIVHSMADEYVGEQEHFTFCDEARAFMFAGVIESIFCTDAQVIETPHGWLVAVTGRSSELDMIVIHQMEGVCMALCDYTFSRASDASANSPDGLKKRHNPESRAAWHARKNAQSQRIENGINAILAHLGHPEALGRESASSTPQSAATGARDRKIKISTPAKGKSSPKSSKKSA